MCTACVNTEAPQLAIVCIQRLLYFCRSALNSNKWLAVVMKTDRHFARLGKAPVSHTVSVCPSVWSADSRTAANGRLLVRFDIGEFKGNLSRICLNWGKILGEFWLNWCKTLGEFGLIGVKYWTNLFKLGQHIGRIWLNWTNLVTFWAKYWTNLVKFGQNIGRIWFNLGKTLGEFGLIGAKYWANLFKLGQNIGRIWLNWVNFVTFWAKYWTNLVKFWQNIGRIWFNWGKTLGEFGLIGAKYWANLFKLGQNIGRILLNWGKKLGNFVKLGKFGYILGKILDEFG